MSYQPLVICLMGPTASGKTDTAIAVAERLPCDIISVDSVMVYRGLDIGSAKPSKTVQQRFPHHLIDIRDPCDAYSAAEFCHDARKLIDDSVARQHYPLLVGGTMLYFRALQQGLAALPSADPEVRQQLEQEAEKLGWPGLHRRLQAIDPQAAERIKPQDQQRIQRALEVYQLTGQTLTSLLATTQHKPLSYPYINIALAPPQRDILHQRIADRFQHMLDEGLVDEVRQLYERGDLNDSLPAIRAVGYRQVWQYLAGELNEQHMPEKAIVATRQYAKRQLTWLRAMKDLHWFDNGGAHMVDDVCAFILSTGKLPNID